MQIFISQNKGGDSDAIIVNAANNLVLLAGFELTNSEEESDNAENFISALNGVNPSGDLINIRSVLVDGGRLGLPEGIWRFIGAKVLDFNSDAYGSGEKCARSMWRFGLGNGYLLPENSYANTYLSKTPLRTERRRSVVDAMLYLPFKANSPCDDVVTLQIFAKNPSLVKFLNLPEGSSVEILSIEEINERKNNGAIFPSLSLIADQQTSSEGITIEARCAWADSSKGEIPDGEEIFIETSGGFISKQRAKLVNGKAQFKFIPTGLEVGDIVTIQAGFRLFSGLSSIDVKVV